MNKAAVAHARQLIDAHQDVHQYVVESDWGGAEWQHKEIELGAHNLLQHLDTTRK